MNIFVLERDLRKNAKALCDAHVRKMGIEAAQMLSITVAAALGKIADTVDPFGQRRYWLWDPQPFTNLYAFNKSQASHPCTLWARSSVDNALWLCDYTDAILDEYAYRFGFGLDTARQVVEIARGVLTKPGLHLPKLGRPTKHVQCIPPRYQTRSITIAYRAYYRGEKQHLLEYTKRKKPVWLRGEQHVD
jgi:hypothetical protein